ncbi:MAG: hypothetical protein KTR35_10905 [Gammaproteobacteria bacterium]|nr:hypothetical protein [Gammaproteobacteria bacterium]
MKFTKIIAAAALAVLSLPAQAEYLGVMNGRSANLDLAPNLSVEGAFVTGDYGAIEADYQNIGARVNFKASPLLVVFGDFGLAELGDFDGNAFGLGAFYMVEGLFTSVDFAAKVSYHLSSQERTGFQDVDFTVLAVEGLFSGKSGLGANGDIGWYFNAGIHRLSAEAGNNDDSETELGFGGGFIVPMASGELYGGVDLVDEMTFGVGYRHFIN